MHCDLPDFIPVVFGRPFLKYCCVADVKQGMKVVLCTVTCQILFLLSLADLFLRYCCVSDVRHGLKGVVCTDLPDYTIVNYSVTHRLLF